MLKDIIEDIILIALVGVALYLVWTKYLSAYFAGAAEAIQKTAAAYKTDTKTITAAVSNPADFVADLFRSGTSYISQSDFRANIAAIDKAQGRK